MAQNTGYQQATYAAKFDPVGNRPLDVEGFLCSVTGNKQAILLLKGHDNPDPNLYEIEGYFNEGDVLNGHPTMNYNTDACPILAVEGFITVSPDSVALNENKNTATVTLESSHEWTLKTTPAYVSLNKASGSKGTTVITLTSKGISGSDTLTFENTVTGDTAVLTVSVATIGFPVEYPHVDNEDVIGLEKPVTYIGEQVWIRKNMNGYSSASFYPDQTKIDYNMQGFNPVFAVTRQEMIDTFGQYFTRTYKNGLLNDIQTHYGDSEVDIFKHQVALLDDYRQLLAFVDNDLKSLLIKSSKSIPADEHDNIRFFYPETWDGNQCIYGSDKYGLSIGGSGIFQPKSPNVEEMNILNNFRLMTRDSDPSDPSHINAFESVGPNACKTSTCTSGSFWAAGIRTLRYIDLPYEIYVNTNSKSFIELPKIETNIPAGYVVLERGALRGYYLHNKVYSKGWTYDEIKKKADDLLAILNKYN